MVMAALLGMFRRKRWLRWSLYLFAAGVLVVLGILTVGGTAVVLWQNPKVQIWVMLKMLNHGSQQPGEIPAEPRLTSAETARLRMNASALRTPEDLFQPTTVWDVRLSFTSNQWFELGPKHVQPIVHFFQPDGSVILRNPNASRNGLAGVFGIDFEWSGADLQFADLAFHNVGIRFKGNGTFVDSQRSYKRPFKVELNRHTRGLRIAGVRTLNFHNLVADASCLRDTLGYELFREAGVPAPRTAFARMRLSIGGKFEDRLLGLYVMVENPDAQWARSQFGTEGVALFKPVTYDLFGDLGTNWASYQGIYDPKTTLSSKQTQRLIDWCKLVSHASDEVFAAQVGSFVDVDEFARFLACQVCLSNYDGPLSDGQNFLFYLDPRDDRFGFVPWDLDHSWGEFKFLATDRQRERASVWHPWVGKNRFLERMLKVPAVREAYRRELQRIRDTLFVPERLCARMTELMDVVEPFVAEESSHRLARFRQETLGAPPSTDSSHTHTNSARQTYSFRHFVYARAKSIDEQLQSPDAGVVLTRRR